jgi:membrane protein implicated in regulation of membrane protease activity
METLLVLYISFAVFAIVATAIALLGKYYFEKHSK